LKKILIYFVVIIFMTITGTIVKSAESDKLLDQAVELIKIDKLDWALELVREVIRKDPSNPRSYLYAGIIYFKKHEYGIAVKQYQLAISFKENYGVAHYNLGLTYEKTGKSKEAYASFIRARDLYKVQNNQKDYEDALKKIKTLEEAGVNETLKPVKVDTSEMVYIEAGEFFMGSDDTSRQNDEKPKHKVYLASYWIDKYEVTNSQYCKFLNAKGREGDSGQKWIYIGDKKGEGKIVKVKGIYKVKAGFENHPVTFVTWYGANTYAKWSGKRLPTEAEWERAARGTDGRLYPWGNKWYQDKCVNNKNSKHTRPVGSYPEGVSPSGAMDMAGNVLEWCSDWYGFYPVTSGTINNPRGPYSGVTRILKGGGWDDNWQCCGSTFRGNYSPGNYDNDLGFRCVKDGE